MRVADAGTPLSEPWPATIHKAIRPTITLTEGAAGFLPGVPLGNCLGMREPGSQAPAFPKLLLSKGRGCVRPVSREQPHAESQR
jgi:hypothetical protein